MEGFCQVLAVGRLAEAGVIGDLATNDSNRPKAVCQQIPMDTRLVPEAEFHFGERPARYRF